MYIEPISSSHVATGFNCGFTEDDLKMNTFIKRHALTKHLNGDSITYVMVDHPPVVAGYINLCKGLLKPEDPLFQNMVPQEAGFPVIQIRIVALDIPYQRLGHGIWLMRRAFAKAIELSDEGEDFAAATLIAVPHRVTWYTDKFGFMPLTKADDKGRLPMYMPFKNVRRYMQTTV